MKRLFFTLITAIALYSGTALAKTDAEAELNKAQDYLQSITTLKADFTQSFTDSEGVQTVLTGTFSLSRPGKLRFEFNEIEDFIVADGLFVYFYDSQEKQQTNAPIGQTLADFILRKTISFKDEDITVENVHKSNGYTAITLTQTQDPAAGSLQLVFSDIPFRLHKWQVTDAQGITVDTRFDNLETGVDFPGGLFAYHDPGARDGRVNE